MTTRLTEISITWFEGRWSCDACPVPSTNETDEVGISSSTPGRPSAHRRGYDRSWRAIVRQAIEVHVRIHGWTCPGWGTPAHHSSDLTGDHELPLALGGRTTKANVQILCRGCNSRKGRQPGQRTQLTLDALGGDPDARQPGDPNPNISGELRACARRGLPRPSRSRADTPAGTDVLRPAGRRRREREHGVNASVSTSPNGRRRPSHTPRGPLTWPRSRVSRLPRAPSAMVPVEIRHSGGPAREARTASSGPDSTYSGRQLVTR